MAQLFDNNASGELFATLDRGAGGTPVGTDVSLALNPGFGNLFPTVSGGSGNFFLVTLQDATGQWEIIKVEDRAGDVLGSVAFPLVRNQEDSNGAKAFPAGARVELRLTAATLELWLQSAGDTLTGNLDFAGNQAQEVDIVNGSGQSTATSIGLFGTTQLDAAHEFNGDVDITGKVITTGDADISGAANVTGVVSAQHVELGVNGRVYFDGATTLSLREATSTRGTVRTDGALNGWGGYDIGSRHGFIDNGSNTCGLYNDVDNEWLVQCGDNSYVRLYFNGVNELETGSGRVTVQNDCYADDFILSSDIALKENLEPITDALSKLASITGSMFTRKKQGRREAGIIAQDVEKVLPEAVSVNNGMKHVSAPQMIGLLVAGINELAEKIDDLSH